MVAFDPGGEIGGASATFHQGYKEHIFTNPIAAMGAKLRPIAIQLRAEKRGQARARAINNDISAWHAERPELQLPSISFFSHALKMQGTWPEIFGVNTKLLAYDHYRLIAVCALPREQKNKLLLKALTMQRTWPDIFAAGSKLLHYDAYRQIAVCALPREQKDQLRQWAETQRQVMTKYPDADADSGRN